MSNEVFSSSSCSSFQHHSSRLSCCLKTFSTSQRILLENKKIFISIFTLTTLPLSLMLFSLSIIATPTRAHIFNLETHVARLSSTPLEATHVYNESRSDAVSLLRLKAFFFLPCYILSLVTAVTAVDSTSLAYNNKNPSVHSAVNAFKAAWQRTLLTAVYGYVIMLLYVHVPFVVAAMVRVPVLRFLVLVVGSGFEVYVMGVVSFGLVVSVLEERFGWGAIRVGSGLMEGRSVFGCVLTGGFVGVTGWIGWSMERLMEGKKRRRRPWAAFVALMSDWRAVLFVGLYGIVIVFGFVIVTVFYCECRRVPLGNSPSKDDETEMVTI